MPASNTHRKRIDTHAHVVPPFYRDWLIAKGIDAGGMPIPQWSPETCLDFMNANGIETSILSVSTPGVVLDENNDVETSKAMARRVNEYCSDLVKTNPKSFGYFATLLLPDVEASIAEARYALDHLNADGIVVLTNVKNKYFGDHDYEPLLEFLNERNASIFIHPSELPTEPVPGIPPYTADFLLNTVRAALNICVHGWHEKFPNVKFILSHAGGFLPYSAARVCMVAGNGDSVVGIKRLKSFYYDIALSGSPYALPSLFALADPERITFGSDWPYANTTRSATMIGLFDNAEVVSAEQRARIERSNAEALFPRLLQYNNQD